MLDHDRNFSDKEIYYATSTNGLMLPSLLISEGMLLLVWLPAL